MRPTYSDRIGGFNPFTVTVLLQVNAKIGDYLTDSCLGMTVGNMDKPIAHIVKLPGIT